MDCATGAYNGLYCGLTGQRAPVWTACTTASGVDCLHKGVKCGVEPAVEPTISPVADSSADIKPP
eukprot:11207412-Lingulodinium_polyedra.AAC.1